MQSHWPLAIALIFCLEFVYVINIESRNSDKPVPIDSIFNKLPKKVNIITHNEPDFTEFQTPHANVLDHVFFKVIATEIDDDFLDHHIVLNSKINTDIKDIIDCTNCFSGLENYYKSPSGCYLFFDYSLAKLIYGINKNPAISIKILNSASYIITDESFIKTIFAVSSLNSLAINIDRYVNVAYKL